MLKTVHGLEHIPRHVLDKIRDRLLWNARRQERIDSLRRASYGPALLSNALGKVSYRPDLIYSFLSANINTVSDASENSRRHQGTERSATSEEGAQGRLGGSALAVEEISSSEESLRPTKRSKN